MFCKVHSGAIDGIESFAVEVEADISDGMPEFSMVGFLAAEVREARDRVRIAIKNSGYKIPPKRITINLSPADIRKEGTAFDLPIAIAVLSALGYLQQEYIEETIIIGELSLDGSIKRVNGVLPIVYNAMKMGYKRCIVPKNNATEAAVVKGIEVYGVTYLNELVNFINKDSIIEEENINLNNLFYGNEGTYGEDFSDISGQEMVKRAVEVAVAGFHNILIIGPPGAGKTMIAKRIPTIIPNMTFDESIEISKVYSVAGLLDKDNAIVLRRPFRAPHHTITQNALTGGGRNPKPGEISLASGGVLFLDELPEFNKSTLEILRQPLEERYVNIARVSGTYKYPANFLLVAAMNPCNCGYYPDRNKCNCSLNQIKKYLGKISSPLLSRIDISVEAPKVEYENLLSSKKGESSENIRKRIMRARRIQLERFIDDDIYNNAQMGKFHIEKYCKTDDKGAAILKDAYKRYDMNARTYHRVLKVSRTIADLDGENMILPKHIMEAVCYRSIDKKYWSDR